MDIHTLSFVFGGVLLLIAILGGGFEIRELKVPKVGWAPRLLAAAGGLAFIALGSQLSPSSEPLAAPATDFTIHDHLDEGQVSEQVNVLIDGKRVGDITIDEHYPDSTITVTVPKPGKYSYTVEANAVFRAGDGLPHKYPGVGQGMINVERGKRFELEGAISGNTWLVMLAEKS